VPAPWDLVVPYSLLPTPHLSGYYLFLMTIGLRSKLGYIVASLETGRENIAS